MANKNFRSVKSQIITAKFLLKVIVIFVLSKMYE